jgi:hypothetical protein
MIFSGANRKSESIFVEQFLIVFHDCGLRFSAVPQKITLRVVHSGRSKGHAISGWGE